MRTTNTIRNRMLIISLLVILCAGLCITGISAYFMVLDRADNITTAGNSRISVKEIFRNPDIVPGVITEITKQVNILNTGKNYSGIRVKAEFSSSDVTDWARIEYNDQPLESGDDKYWILSGDYWYYSVPLAPGEESEMLFEKITCNKPTHEQVQDFNVYIYAESRNCKDTDSASDIEALWQ